MHREQRVDQLFASTQALIRGWKNYFFKLLGPENISPAQMGTLLYLQTNGRTHGRSIAADLHLSASALSQLLDSLDAAGYITREHDQADRRIIYFGLSRAGERKVADLEDKRRSFFTQITEILTEDEIAAMIHIQTKLSQQIEQQK